jgi:2-polyprenyl-3-methyl-5-hydroxy-6-metoxy-1,4-benzoquinol methylase
MERLALIQKVKDELNDKIAIHNNAKRNLIAARRNLFNLQEQLPKIEKRYWTVKSELKLVQRKLFYLEKPEELYVEEFYSKRHKSMRNWEIKLGKNLVELFSIKSIVDFGCGLGAYLEGAMLAGAAPVLGYDLMYEKAIKYASDVIKPFMKYGNVGEFIDCDKFDAVLSIETAEHLAEEEADAFVDNLVNASSRIIIVSASNAGGRYHINRQLKPYWIEKFTARDFIYSQESVDKLYDAWHYNGCPAYILRNLMVFYQQQTT